LADENDKVKKAVGINASKNNKMIAPKIQRDIANCFAKVRKGRLHFFTNYVISHNL
jgi:hypothetical protein